MNQFLNTERGGLAIWKQAADRLAEEIKSGVFRPGEQLVNERALAERYSVHRHTIRRAISDLVQRGLLSVQHGRGTFVEEAAALNYRIGPETRFNRNIAELSKQSNGRILSSRTEACSADVGEKLQLPVGAAVQKLDILREVGGIPLIRSQHWFDGERFADIADRFDTNGQSLTQALGTYNLTGIRRTYSAVFARIPSQAEARELKQPLNVPVIVWETLKSDGGEQLLDYGVALVAGERVKLILE